MAKCNDSTIAELNVTVQVTDNRCLHLSRTDGRRHWSVSCNDSAKSCTISGAAAGAHSGASWQDRSGEGMQARTPHLGLVQLFRSLPPLHFDSKETRPVNPLWVSKYRGNPYKLLGEPNWKTSTEIGSTPLLTISLLSNTPHLHKL